MNRKNFSRNSILVALFGSTLLGIVISPAMAQDQYHPTIQIAQKNRESNQSNMEQALSSLELANDFLEKATPDKGGHRVQAIALVKQAIAETERGIEFDLTHSGEARRRRNVAGRRIQPVAQNAEYQPNMQRALSSLVNAQKSLERATPDKGGHRTKAIDLVKRAIKETQLGIQYDRTHKNDNQNSVNQSNMRRAISSLQEAQKYLESATRDKGGHRVKALELVQQAIRETQQGIEFDRTHGND